MDSRASIVFVQLAANDFLNGQYNTVLTPQSNQCATLFDRLWCIVNLKDSAIRWKLRRRQIVLKSRRFIKMSTGLYGALSLTPVPIELIIYVKFFRVLEMKSRPKINLVSCLCTQKNEIAVFRSFFCRARLWYENSFIWVFQLSSIFFSTSR